jgi:hypothetical protein
MNKITLELLDQIKDDSEIKSTSFYCKLYKVEVVGGLECLKKIRFEDVESFKHALLFHYDHLEQCGLDLGTYILKIEVHSTLYKDPDNTYIHDESHQIRFKVENIIVPLAF